MTALNIDFPFFDQVSGLNWDTTYKNIIPKVIAAENINEYYRTLTREILIQYWKEVLKNWKDDFN